MFEKVVRLKIFLLFCVLFVFIFFRVGDGVGVLFCFGFFFRIKQLKPTFASKPLAPFSRLFLFSKCWWCVSIFCLLRLDNGVS